MILNNWMSGQWVLDLQTTIILFPIGRNPTFQQTLNAGLIFYTQ